MSPRCLSFTLWNFNQSSQPQVYWNGYSLMGSVPFLRQLFASQTCFDHKSFVTLLFDLKIQCHRRFFPTVSELSVFRQSFSFIFKWAFYSYVHCINVMEYGEVFWDSRLWLLSHSILNMIIKFLYIQVFKTVKLL